ncbi:hypothetical protein [Burkholderia ubonensis]|uniref:hypothetical protein n=1 Tax=Burkholderia ubonensis TaxID=101571 RepID=UPI0012F8F3B0|nr:hypothetical protein [Burkholderia ubonensis]
MEKPDIVVLQSCPPGHAKWRQPRMILFVFMRLHDIRAHMSRPWHAPCACCCERDETCSFPKRRRVGRHVEPHRATQPSVDAGRVDHDACADIPIAVRDAGDRSVFDSRDHSAGRRARIANPCRQRFRTQAVEKEAIAPGSQKSFDAAQSLMSSANGLPNPKVARKVRRRLPEVPPVFLLPTVPGYAAASEANQPTRI